MKKINIIGAALAVVCLTVLTVKMFGNYPPSNGNWLWFAGVFVGGFFAADSK